MSRILLTILSFYLLLNFSFSQSESSSSVIWSKVETYTSTIVSLPDNYDPKKEHTLVVGLHGFGDTAENFQSFSQPFTDAGFIFATPEAPYSYLRKDGSIGYEWFLYDISSYIMLERPASKMEIAAMRLSSEKQMGQIFKDLKESYNVGEVYLAGMSQGGIISYLTGIHHHDIVDGIIIFGSVVDEDWLGTDDIQEGNNVRALIIQGEKDKAVPFVFAEAARDLLKKNGYPVIYKSFDGGHIVPRHLLGYVVDWINEK